MFVLYLVVGNLVLAVPWVDSGFVGPWTSFNATGAAALSRLIGIEAYASGTRISYELGSLNVLTGCNGVEALLILVAAFLAFPSPWTRRLLGVLAGTVAIFGANLIRLVNLVVVAKFFPAWLEIFHIYIWQTLIVMIAFALFLSWGMFFARVKPVTSPSGGT